MDYKQVVPDSVDPPSQAPTHFYILRTTAVLVGFQGVGGDSTRMEAPWKPATLEPGALTAVGLQGQVRYHYTSD